MKLHRPITVEERDTLIEHLGEIVAWNKQHAVLRTDLIEVLQAQISLRKSLLKLRESADGTNPKDTSKMIEQERSLELLDATAAKKEEAIAEHIAAGDPLAHRTKRTIIQVAGEMAEAVHEEITALLRPYFRDAAHARNAAAHADALRIIAANLSMGTPPYGLGKDYWGPENTPRELSKIAAQAGALAENRDFIPDANSEEAPAVYAPATHEQGSRPMEEIFANDL